MDIPIFVQLWLKQQNHMPDNMGFPTDVDFFSDIILSEYMGGDRKGQKRYSHQSVESVEDFDEWYILDAPG